MDHSFYSPYSMNFLKVNFTYSP